VQLFWRTFGLQAIGGPTISAKVSLSIVMDVVDVENPIQLPYCGPKNMRPIYPI